MSRKRPSGDTDDRSAQGPLTTWDTLPRMRPAVKAVHICASVKLQIITRSESAWNS